jgi:hypothetical protein
LYFSGIRFDLDIDELNARWADPENIDSWSQMVIKHTEDTIDLLTDAPQSGIWAMNADGSIEYSRFAYHRRAVASEAEAFFLRILNAGDYRYEGADLGILITRGRSMTDRFELTPRAKNWIAGIKSQYRAKPLSAPVAVAEPAFKIL